MEWDISPERAAEPPACPHNPPMARAHLCHGGNAGAWTEERARYLNFRQPDLGEKNPALVIKLLSCEPHWHFEIKPLGFWDFYAQGSSRIKGGLWSSEITHVICFISFLPPFFFLFFFKLFKSVTAISQVLSAAMRKYIGAELHQPAATTFIFMQRLQSQAPEECETKPSRHFSQTCFCSSSWRKWVWDPILLLYCHVCQRCPSRADSCDELTNNL